VNVTVLPDRDADPPLLAIEVGVAGARPPSGRQGGLDILRKFLPERRIVGDQVGSLRVRKPIDGCRSGHFIAS
jgi:hypothetical protein